VLRLLESTTIRELANAVEQALSIGATSQDAIRLILEHRREQPVRMFALDGHLHWRQSRSNRQTFMPIAACW